MNVQFSKHALERFRERTGRPDATIDDLSAAYFAAVPAPTWMLKLVHHKSRETAATMHERIVFVTEFIADDWVVVATVLSASLLKRRKGKGKRAA